MKNGYVPLYRKYRPQKIDDVVGQSHIKTALRNAIELNKVSHAYLFTGPRGTGKTSTARILAKSLNCINGPTLNPCDECESCKSVINSLPIDVIEIDAASNRSVEDAQNILEKVQYAPTFGKFKIYIVDEVHMLSSHAFNALLKTLEEPPSNVVFIFATTEAHKVPDTIKSRCQRFDFKRITTDDIIEHLNRIAKLEKIKISQNAINLIAQNCSGCMRDSLALLDQVSILGLNNEIAEDDINNLLGRISFDILNKLAENIIESAPNEAMMVLEEIYHNGNEPVQILTNLLHYFKNLLISKSCDKTSIPTLTGLTDEQNSLLMKQSETLELHQIVFLVNKTADYIKEIKSATNQHLWLDVAIIDLANLSVNTKLQDMQNRIMQLESGSIQNNVDRPLLVKNVIDNKSKDATDANISEDFATEPDVKEMADKEPEIIEHQNEIVSAEPEKIHRTSPQPTNNKQVQNLNIKEAWTQILRSIQSQPAQALFSVANPVKVDKDGIIITFKVPSFVEKANMSEKKDFLVAAVSEVFGAVNIPLTIRTPQASDVEQGKVVLNQVKKNNVVTPPQQDESDVGIEEYNEMKQQNVSTKTVNESESHDTSDQSKMIKELFDGKYMN